MIPPEAPSAPPPQGRAASGPAEPDPRRPLGGVGFVIAAWLIALLMMPIVGPVAGIVAWPFYSKGIKSYVLYIALGTLVGALNMHDLFRAKVV